MTEKEKLGEHFKNLREIIPSSDYENKPISQQELADKSNGITKNYIGTVERGEANPTLEKLILQAKAVNMKTFKITGIEIDIEKFLKEVELEKIQKAKIKEEKKNKKDA